ncbi:hypothetical protein K3718_11260 [Leisingera aquaemixtae]|uniref:Uncharacterized protein n=1 Tax=Leisingera aquaemixtae TaxID=1396826 RepID=A0ABY5WFB3_9RHOB|nr:hypothetical protein [Leisingera aquaemixtae]UWQ40147.1 hypothetical protein K3718_11260 [Leisingera aquaemixtae]
MKLKDVIRLEKTVENYGCWSKGEIDRAAWPLKRKKLKFSSDWKWRVVTLSASGREFRVLLRLNPLLEQFYAVLGEVREGAIAVLCSHDLHTSHSNWHCHTATGNIEDVFPGVWRDKSSFRFWPSYTGECTEVFDVTTQSAMTIASKLYRFAAPAQGELSV